MIKLLALAVCAVLVGLDQLIKHWAVLNLADDTRNAVIPDLFYLSYVENRGAAFGILENKTVLLAVVSVLVMAIAIYLIGSGVVKSRFLLWSFTFVLAGGIGNCIDRFVRGYVVDYLDFSALFGFPVFNLADCCVVTGTVMILAYILYTDRKKQDEPEGGTKAALADEPPTLSGENDALSDEIAADEQAEAES